MTKLAGKPKRLKSGEGLKGSKLWTSQSPIKRTQYTLQKQERKNPVLFWIIVVLIIFVVLYFTGALALFYSGTGFGN